MTYSYDYVVPRGKQGLKSIHYTKRFSTLDSAFSHARKRQVSGKALQAEFWDVSNPYDQKIAGNLNLSGKFVDFPPTGYYSSPKGWRGESARHSMAARRGHARRRFS